MKIRIFMVLMWFHLNVQAQNVQWFLWVPSESVVAQGVYGDPNQPIAQGDDFSDFEVNDYLPFVIPDQTAITGLVLEPDGETFALWLSLSTPVAGFMPGDVMRCVAGNCQLAFSAAEDLGVGTQVGIDALGLGESGGLLLSFDVGFVFDGTYINPQGLYLVGTVASNLVLVEQTDEIPGMQQNGNMTAYATTNDNGQGFMSFYGGDVIHARPNELFFAHEMQVIPSVNVSGYFALGLTEQTRDMAAFDAFTSGTQDFTNSSMVVSEGAGLVNIPVSRSHGFEGFVRIKMTTNGGSAVLGTDYELMMPTAQWADDETGVVNMTVNVLDNALLDGTRNVYFILEPDSQFASISGFSSTYELVITDDDGDLIFADGFD